MSDTDPVITAYDDWATTYDTERNRPRDLVVAVVRGWMPDLQDRDVFEFGCGTGKNTMTVAPLARSSFPQAEDRPFRSATRGWPLARSDTGVHHGVIGTRA